MAGQTTHPSGRSTAVASLAEDGPRRGLAEATAEALESLCADFGDVLTPGALESMMTLWANFCDAVADFRRQKGRGGDGEDGVTGARRPKRAISSADLEAISDPDP